MGHWEAKATYADGTEETRDFSVNTGILPGLTMDNEKAKIKEFMVNLKSEEEIECKDCTVKYVEEE